MHGRGRRLVIGSMKHARAGFSFVEMLIVIAIMAILVAAAIPFFQEGVADARRAAILANIHTLHTAEAQYLSRYGTWAGSLAELGPSRNAAAGADGARLIAGDLATGDKGGYRY